MHSCARWSSSPTSPMGTSPSNEEPSSCWSKTPSNTCLNYCRNHFTYCDCDCEDMIDVQRPSVSVLTLQYMAQSLVTYIVGLNMGFRYACVRVCVRWDWQLLWMRVGSLCAPLLPRLRPDLPDLFLRHRRQQSITVWKTFLGVPSNKSGHAGSAKSSVAAPNKIPPPSTRNPPPAPTNQPIDAHNIGITTKAGKLVTHMTCPHYHSARPSLCSCSLSLFLLSL